MRFLSLFSGISAECAAWHPLGWSCAAFAEVEPFPCSVLEHHYPNTPNLGDVTKITKEQIEGLGKINVVTGGFPCQDLSVAGLRKGLKNADGTNTRSGLFFTALQIAEWAAPRWLILENVCGLFSSNNGEDFAEVVGTLCGASFNVPGDGWRNAGVAVGPKGLVEWVTLDAQYVRVESHPRAVPQRRRRVFIVRDSGDWAGRSPLFLVPESLRGDSPPRREAGQRVTHDVAPSLTASGRGVERGGDTRGQDPVIAVPEVAATLRSGSTNKASHGKLNGTDRVTMIPVAHSLRAEGFDASEDGTGAQAVAFTQNQAGDVLSGEIMHSLGTNSNSSGRNAPNVATPMAVRRLTPMECLRLMGHKDSYLDFIYKGKPPADGVKYKAIGNGQAVNVMRWIGQRIQTVKTLDSQNPQSQAK